MSQDNVSHVCLGLKKTGFSKPTSEMSSPSLPSERKEENVKIFLKAFAGDATSLVIGLQRENWFVHGNSAGPA